MIELQLKHYIYLILAIGFAGTIVSKQLKLSAKKKSVSAKASEKNPNKNRKPGTWVPETYKFPVPAPFPNWDIEKTRPLPYRAFKHKYNVTMGIRNMETDLWIELDNEWLKFHNDKVRRAEEMGTDVYSTFPEARAAAFELLDEFWSYLPARYPELFKQLPSGLENLVTGEIFTFKNCNPDLVTEDPMLIAAKMIQDDLAIMIEGKDGVYYLKAGAIILPGFWRFKDKVGMPLYEIHTSGDVPQYKEKLHSGMAKFFTRLTCDKPVVRNNYFIQTDDELAWSSSIGDEKEDTVGWNTAVPATTAQQLYFRSERQSLRRLPKTGGIVFTIRTYFCPISELCEEPHVPRRLLNAIESWADDVKEYRGYSKFKDVLLPYLEEKALEQEAKGVSIEKEPSVYPF